MNSTNPINSLNDIKVLTIASQKGGCGKSTLAIHIAVIAQQEGYEVIVADLDPNSQTAAEWATERKSDTPTVIKADTDNINDLYNQAKEEGFNLLILDCPPYLNDVITGATQISNFTLIPSQPRFADIRTIRRTLTSTVPPYSVVLNICTPGYNGQESLKTTEARKILKSFEINISDYSITKREAFSDALNGGEAVNEFEPKSKATIEIKNLWNWLQEKL